MLLTAAIIGLFVLSEPWNAILLGVAAVVEVGELYLWRLYLKRFRVRGGVEGMVGERAQIIQACDPRGRVRVRGEIWRAVAAEGEALEAGERATVLAVDGLEVRVERRR